MTFGLLCFITIRKTDDDELPVPKEQLNYAVTLIIVFGTLLITISLPFINYKNKVENKIKVQLNEKIL